ncbi:hypothetical protein F976_02298 [Acinetobacter baumannii NIPH 1734]|jgi:hypothetical protein|nr:hypothetical protein F976_02298 [Acinetobacter baumannii NIPH 1734]
MMELLLSGGLEVENLYRYISFQSVSFKYKEVNNEMKISL